MAWGRFCHLPCHRAPRHCVTHPALPCAGRPATLVAMALYEVTDEGLVARSAATFADLGLYERDTSSGSCATASRS